MNERGRWEAASLMLMMRRFADRYRMVLTALVGALLAVGVDLDPDMLRGGDGDVQVMVCRLCGLYAVEDKSA